MGSKKPYEKRINLGIDLRNPKYKRAYEYIMEHPRGKFRFICDCILQVMEGNAGRDLKEMKYLDTQEVLLSFLTNPILLQSLAREVAQFVSCSQTEDLMQKVQSSKEVIRTNNRIENQIIKQNKRQQEEYKLVKLDEEIDDVPKYEIPMLDIDMLTGISAWDELME